MIAQIGDDDEDEHDDADHDAKDGKDDYEQYGNEPQVQIWCEAKTFCLGHPCLWRPSPDNNTCEVMMLTMMMIMTKTAQYDVVKTILVYGGNYLITILAM